MTLKMRSKVKFKVTERFATYGFLYVHNWFLSSKVTNKRDISHFVPWPWKWGQRSNSRSRKDLPHMVSYMSTIDFLALKSKISEILVIFVEWPWKWGQRSNSRSREDLPDMVSYMSTIDSLALKSIINEILAILSNDLENEVKGQIQGHGHIWFPICPQLTPEP